ncbi:tonB family protein [Plesiocystis pacifica SIR-1]|uniref:TonB family protein n=1 Tax=Plesiocystis pacifica SIR-1 TaxID=391625 RepID=A6GGD1_9BACT|nr:tonB family protein [Plesiocystis pacifica SIR-1]
MLRAVRRLALILSLIAAVLGTATALGPGTAHAGAGEGEGELAPAEEASPESELVPPTAKGSVAIQYPEALLEREEPPGGTVIVQYVVGVDGQTKELEVLQSVDPELDRIVVEAVDALEFEPALYRGQPVEVVLSVAVEIGPPEPAPEPDTDTETETGEGTLPGAFDSDGTQAPGDAEAPVAIRGRIREAGQRTPIEGATVIAVPAPEGWPLGQIRGKRYEEAVEPQWQVQATTDAEGRFELRGVPPGRVRIIALSRGYERLDSIEELAGGGAILELEYFDRRLPSNPYRTEVTVDRELPEVTRRTITPEEINLLPGTQGDALKSIQNFPGVARPPFGAGLIVVRGSAPSDTKTYLGYHEIPQLFHFGALTSVFNSDILAQIDFIPGNFDARFGNAIGGIINVQPRKGRRDGYHGYIDSDLFDTGVLVEGPIGKGSFALSARRSYIDALLLAVIPAGSGIDFNVAPRYYDYQALFDYPVGPGNFSVRVFGSDDQLEVVAPSVNEEEADANDGFDTQIAFHRVDMVYEAEQGPWSFLFTPSYRHEQLGGVGGDIFSFRVTRDVFNLRAELGYRLSKRAGLRIGTEVAAGEYSLEARAPGFPQPGQGDNGEFLAADLGGAFGSFSLYSTATIAASDRLVLYPGVRLAYNGVVLNRAGLDPRFRLAWKLTEDTTFKAGVGLFSQYPDVFELNDVWGNPNIALERSIHTSAGVAHMFDSIDLLVEGTAFYKYVYDLAVPTDVLLINNGAGATIVPERFDNAGYGHVAGVELLVRKNLTNNLFGWVSYTFSRALYDLDDGWGLIPFDFDQPHILTAIAVYKLPRGWSLGGRFRLVSGNPYIPVYNGIDDVSTGGTFPLEGPRNSERNPAFHQLDVRVDKKWTWRYVGLNAYVDIQNIYNRRNIEGRTYAYDYTQFNVLAGLPILPSVGLKLDW